MKSIYQNVMDLLEKEKTKVSKKTLEVLNREGIAGIVSKNGMFWFESYSRGNNCPKYIYNYLIKFITRKMKLTYLHSVI